MYTYIIFYTAYHFTCIYIYLNIYIYLYIYHIFLFFTAYHLYIYIYPNYIGFNRICWGLVALHFLDLHQRMPPAALEGPWSKHVLPESLAIGYPVANILVAFNSNQVVRFNCSFQQIRFRGPDRHSSFNGILLRHTHRILLLQHSWNPSVKGTPWFHDGGGPKSFLSLEPPSNIMAGFQQCY